ncbi:hypothetical protein AVL61_09230 [Kocuria rosea subsp. polaris]|uniref:DNA helicase n=1 Tax=Kocuria rosea subsp. polaris TaxID=136273 RepID=A0A0W8IJG2_KOCRO|nr:DUF3320 domain-containing protein [Kocuria polaris]KUG60124.1 hypothetical protein AVL61_09230 [Kocuria polaris]
MPETLPSEAIQRAALAMARTLGPWVADHAPEPGDPQSWVAQAQREDKLNGRPVRRYSLGDPRFLLRLLIQEWKQFDHRITPLHSSYARELTHSLNVCAHEPLTITAADAERAVDTMRLLLESLGLAAPAAEETGASAVEKTLADAGAHEPAADVPDQISGRAIEAESPQDALEGVPADRDDLPPGTRATTVTSGPLAVTVLFREAVNYALVNNGVSPLLEVRVRNTDRAAPHALEQLVLVLDDSSEELATPRRFDPLTVGPGGEVLLDGTDVAWPLDHTAFAALDEARTVSLRINATVDGAVATGTTSVRLLARDEWYARSIPELLAAFITPNAPAVRQILDRAADLLKERTGDSSLDGYQSGSERAVEIGRAVYDALASFGIRYTEPPASFESTGQKIRPVDRMLSERWGTCLDLTVAYAAALEQAGLNPVVVRVPGHAFAGFLTAEAQLPELALGDRGLLQNFVRGGLLLPVETTALVEGKDVGFDDARQATARHWGSDGEVLHVLDVAAAHRRIRPLPRVLVEGDTVVIEVEKAPEALLPGTGSGRRSASGSGAAVDRTVYPARVARWRSALLDLTMRNPLLKLKRTGSVSFVVPERALPDLEDILASGQRLRLRPADDLSEIDNAQGRHSAAQLPEEVLEAVLRNELVVHTDHTAARHEGTLDGLRRKAKVVLEETGANNLFVTIGALSWKDRAGKEGLAPLFLLPVTLTGRKNQPFHVQVEDGAEARPNYCLIEKLQQDYGLEIPVLAEPPADDSGMDVAHVFEELRRTLALHGLPFTVEPVVRLAMLQFSTLEMWRDLSENWESFLDNPLVGHLVNTPTEPFDDPVEAPETDEHDEARRHLPVPTDGSQLKAVAWATAGRTFVLEGPPGTGKSQTITNMIADSLAAGRKVLFVAEKQAALQVVRGRLEKVGLGPLTLELHGRQQSIKSVRSQLVDSWDARVRTPSSAFGVLRDQHAAAVADLARYPHALHRPTRGRSVWEAHQNVLALTGSATGTELREDIVVPGTLVADPERAETVFRTASALEQLLPDLGHAPDQDEWSLAGPEQTSDDEHGGPVLQPVQQLLAALHGLDERVAALLRTTDEVEHWRTLAAWLRDVDANRAMPPAHYREVFTVTWHQELRRALDDIRQVLARHETLLRSLHPAAFTADLDAHRQALAEAQGKLFGKRKAVQAVIDGLRPLVVSADTSCLEDPSTFLDALHAVQHDEQGLRYRTGTLLPAGLQWSLTAPDPLSVPASVLAFAEALEPVLDAFPDQDDALSALFTTTSGSTTGRATTRIGLGPTTAAFVEAWSSTVEFLGATEASVARWRKDSSVLDRLAATASVWQDQVDRQRDRRLRSYRAVESLLQELEHAGFGSLARDLRAGTMPVTGLTERLQRAVAHEVRSDTLEEANLTSFDAAARDRQVASYLDLSGQVRRRLRSDLPAQVLAATGINREKLTKQQAEFNRLIHQKRGGSIREIMEKTGPVLLDLTPCLLMSPHSVSKYLPVGAVDFDVVVFDEASQIRVADAIGAMGRSKAVVVVGDSQQMPPSSMFAATAGDDDLDSPGEDGLTVADQDSILTEAVDSNVQSLGLTWHYRSQDESLIAFSNRRYYRGELSSFPAPPEPRPGLGVSWERVDGEFDGGAGGTRTNEVEAQRIVEETVELLREDPDASIGVVTFNTQQRDLVLDKLEQSTVRVVQNALVRAEDPLFVKNLENVQGDERDVVLFSLAFSRNKDTGTLRLNFGPLTAAGGQRRLNVAITRARRAIRIFSSFGPEDIDLARTSSEGLRHLREYLVFAREHGHDDVHRPTGESWDLHRQDVAAALRAAGLEVAEDIGMSNFRVDLAARTSPEHEWVGLLLDGPAWARRTIVSDRDALPTQVLTGAMGWRHLERVWLPAWIRSRSAVVQEIADTAQRAVRQPDEPPAQDAVDDGQETGATQAPSESAAERGGGPDREPVLIGAPPTAPGPDEDHVLVAGNVGTASRQSQAPEDPAEIEPLGSVRPSSPAEQDATAGSYQPAPHRVAGDRAVLDTITAPTNKQLVREHLEEIVAAEGPIEAQRLARLLANRFGLQRVQAQRQETILGCLPKNRRSRTVLGTFYWPEGMTPDNYTGYRRTPADGEKRRVTEIAPQEIGNAVLDVLRSDGPSPVVDVMQALNDVFGFNRTGREIRERYQQVLDLMERDGRLVRQDEVLVLPGS